MATVVSKTIEASGGDYTSLAGFESGEERDLVTLDEIAQGVVGGGFNAQSTDFDITGWTTDATRYIQFVADAADEFEFTGTLDTTKAYCDFGNSLQFEIDILEFCRFEGLQFRRNNDATGGAGRAFIRISGADNVDAYFDRCYIQTDDTGDRGVYQLDNRGSTGAPRMIVRNCLLVMLGTGIAHGMSAERVSGTSRWIYSLNNTVIGFSNAISASGNQAAICVEASNTLFQDNTSDCDGTGRFEGDYNLTDNAGTDDIPGANTITSTTITFVNKAGGDYHLASGDENNGQDLSSHTFAFTEDVDEDTRSSWHIGFDERVAAAAAFPHFEFRVPAVA